MPILQYVDDTLVMVEANEENIVNLIVIMIIQGPFNINTQKYSYREYSCPSTSS